jgi:hypothetical protein
MKAPLHASKKRYDGVQSTEKCGIASQTGQPVDRAGAVVTNQISLGGKCLSVLGASLPRKDDRSKHGEDTNLQGNPSSGQMRHTCSQPPAYIPTQLKLASLTHYSRLGLFVILQHQQDFSSSSSPHTYFSLITVSPGQGGLVHGGEGVSRVENCGHGVVDRVLGGHGLCVIGFVNTIETNTPQRQKVDERQ